VFSQVKRLVAVVHVVGQIQRHVAAAAAAEV